MRLFRKATQPAKTGLDTLRTWLEHGAFTHRCQCLPGGRNQVGHEWAKLIQPTARALLSRGSFLRLLGNSNEVWRMNTLHPSSQPTSDVRALMPGGDLNWEAVSLTVNPQPQLRLYWPGTEHNGHATLTALTVRTTCDLLLSRCSEWPLMQAYDHYPLALTEQTIQPMTMGSLHQLLQKLPGYLEQA